MTPLAVALALVGLGAALLVARGLALRDEGRVVPAAAPSFEEEMPRPEPPKEPRMPPAALARPSQIARAAKEAAARPAPAAPEDESEPAPLEPQGGEAPLTPKQRERIERLMSAVRAEFDGLLAEEKRRREGGA
jgi:hypothetical protein